MIKRSPVTIQIHRPRTRHAAAVCLLLCLVPAICVPTRVQAGDTPAVRPANKLIVGVYRDVGAGPSAKKLIDVLKNDSRIEVRELTAEAIRKGQLAKLDVLIHPGGSGSKQGRQLGEEGRDAIRDFIRKGGGFVGVCAGAYLASADYNWSLNVLDAKVLDRKHWARGKGTVKLSLSKAGSETLQLKRQSLQIYYAQGPLLAPHDDPEIPDYETIATFETEIAKNGAPPGVMMGTTAIASGRFGEGRVFCFSPHPELTKGLGPLLHRAVHYVAAESPTASRQATTP